MTPIEQAARQALEVPNEVTGWQWADPMRVMDEVGDAIAALREALSGVQALSAAPAVAAPAAPTPEHIAAMERAWLWMDSQADQQSKGGHATFDLMMLRDERDALRAAIDAAPKVAPGEPTQEMVDAVMSLVDLEMGDPEDHRYDDGSKLAAHIYRAVLALAPQQEAQEPCQTCTAMARTAMMDQVSFDRKPDCYAIRQITDDEGVEEWEDIRTSPDVAREEANNMMATRRGEVYEVVPLWTTPQPAPAPLSDDDVRDAAFEAVRKKLCALPRFSFLSDRFGVRRVPDKSGSWIAFDDAHELFDPVAVDAALAAQGGK